MTEITIEVVVIVSIICGFMIDEFIRYIEREMHETRTIEASREYTLSDEQMHRIERILRESENEDDDD